jgi:glutamine phosphoribosylpyrophosphate amidotransferase
MLRRVVPDPQNHCFACFDGNYPVELETEIKKNIEYKDWDFSYRRL